VTTTKTGLPWRRAVVVVGGAAAAASVASSLWVRATYVPDGGGPTVTVPGDPARLAAGRAIYLQYCAGCHGVNLEGQPNWQQRLPTGRMPAPPHDDAGHTWHHSHDLLFGIVKHGVVPAYAPPKYQSDMPAFGNVLGDDEIRAVLAYIASHWSPKVRDWRAEMLRQIPEMRRGTRRGTAQ
jgi:mono/diheme cytochrome c family protein